MPEPQPFAVDPIEAIEFLRRKLDVPTATWTDVWQAMHDRAFMVAGAQGEALVEKLVQGQTILVPEGIDSDFAYHPGRSLLPPP